jgi:hypothetical protein
MLPTIISSKLTVTGWPVLAGVHLSPARDVSGFHLPALEVGVALAVVGALLGVVAAVDVAVVGAAVVTVALVGAAVGALVGARVGEASRVRLPRAALAGAAANMQSAAMRLKACTEVVANGHDGVSWVLQTASC